MSEKDKDNLVITLEKNDGNWVITEESLDALKNFDRQRAPKDGDIHLSLGGDVMILKNGIWEKQ